MFKSTAFSAMVSGLNIDFKSTEFNSSSGINVCKASISFSIGNIKTFSIVKFNEFLKGKLFSILFNKTIEVILSEFIL